jgi:sulfhydrogenase subunit delta
MKTKRKPKLAVWKFASCDGCQLSLLDCEDELLAVAGEVEIANFLEASRAVVKGPYDLSLVEGSITTPHDTERIHQIRRASKRLVTIGACATAGGIQALRNFKDVKEFMRIVYATPAYIETLNKSTPISDHVFVDFELRGCPISKHQLVEVISAFLQDRKPNTPPHSVCVECKLRGTVCVMVAHGTPMPRAGHACRLRRDLPRLQPWLLRLLWTAGHAKHRVAQRVVEPQTRRERTGSRARLPRL